MIEVKAVGKPSMRADGFLMLEVRQVEEALRNPDFYVYVVENGRQGNREQFRTVVLGGEPLRRLIGRAKERRYYEVAVPVKEYDVAPRAEPLTPP